MDLTEIYAPVQYELEQVDGIIKEKLISGAVNGSIAEVNDYLLRSAGKRLRPALVLLSAKANGLKNGAAGAAVNIAAAFELIHMASLVHDDVIDSAHIRHARPTINAKWAENVSVALGDYINSIAFDLIASYNNEGVLKVMSSSAKAMCEGELLQVLKRENFNIEEEDYISIIRKKTAVLFAAASRSGAMLAGAEESTVEAMYDFGINFGIAFQIIDDYMDLAAEQDEIRKAPGQDIKAGEATLPLLNLWEALEENDKINLKQLIAGSRDKDTLNSIREMLFSSGAADKTKQTVEGFLNQARQKLEVIDDTDAKAGLLRLADFIFFRGFNGV